MKNLKADPPTLVIVYRNLHRVFFLIFGIYSIAIHLQTNNEPIQNMNEKTTHCIAMHGHLFPIYS